MRKNEARHITRRTRFLRTWHPGRKAGVLVATASAVVAIGGGVGGYALASSTGSSLVTATSQVSNHPDTTSGGSGTACTSSPNGPVWARDAYETEMTAVNTGTNTWRVTIQDKGSFAGFADPNTCNALTSKGSLLGLYTVSVTSTGTPSQATLKSSYSGDISTTQMVQDFFGDPSATVAGGDYFFVYQHGAYVQTTSSIYGDVRASQ
jgi:hypothetical protein